MRPLTFCIDSDGCLHTWLWHIPTHTAPVSCLGAHICSSGSPEFCYVQFGFVYSQEDACTGVVSDFYCWHWRFGDDLKPLDDGKIGLFAEGQDSQWPTVQDYYVPLRKLHRILVNHWSVVNTIIRSRLRKSCKYRQKCVQLLIEVVNTIIYTDRMQHRICCNST